MYWSSLSGIAAISLVLPASAAAQDARDIVRRSLELENRNSELARQYTFLERIDQRDLDGSGRVKRRTVRTYDVTLLEGSPYRRLVQRDDKPLPPEEEKKEQQKLEKSIAQRGKETATERARRLAEWEKRRRQQRQRLMEIPDAFDFRIAGQDTVDGRPVWVIDATPHAGYRPKSALAKFLLKMRGRLWIDRNDLEWVSAEAEVLDTISLGWFLVRVDKGTRMRFESTRVNDEVWLPRRVDVAGAARLLVKRFRSDIEITFSNYRKFQTDSRVVSTEEKR